MAIRSTIRAPVRRSALVVEHGQPLDPASYLIGRMTGTPTAARQVLIRTLITSLRAGGVWTKTNILYVPAAHDVQAARLNWIGNSSYDLTQTGTVTFTADQGFAGNGTDGYHSTGFAATNSIAQDSHYASVWTRTDVNANQTDFGTNRIKITSRNVGVLSTNSSNTSADSVAVADSIGMTTISRGSASAYSRYRNGSSLGDATSTSSGTGANVLLIGARGTTTPDTFSTREIAFVAFGQSALTSGEQLALYNAVNTYLAAIGAA